jgi:hypothetical protein
VHDVHTEGKDMWNYTTFKIGLIGIIWKKWNYLELYGIICDLFGIIGIIWNYWNYLELFGIICELFGITFGITYWNYLEGLLELL